MDLTKELRSEIADQIIRVVAPVGFFSMILAGIGIILFGGQQYHRLIPAVPAIIIVIPSWIYNKKGKPLTGIIFLIAGICFSVIVGMAVSGGIHALAYTTTLVIITIFTVLYGIWGGIVFGLFAMVSGAVFFILIKYGFLGPVDEPTTPFLFFIHAILLAMQFFFVLVPVRLMFKALAETRHRSEELQKAVTERKQAQNELQSILNKTPDIIYRLDPEGKITYISNMIQKYGYNPESFIGKYILDFIHPDDRAVARQRIQEKKSGIRSSNDIEIRISFPESNFNNTEETRTWIPFNISSEGLYKDDRATSESFIGIQGIAHDISRIRHFEQQVDKLAVVVEQAAEEVMITDQAGVIQYVNPMFVNVTGYSLSEVVGNTPRIFKSGKQDNFFYSNLWKTITNGESWKGHIRNKIKNGNIILQDVTITPIFDTTGKITGYASIRRDITRQTRIQEQIQQTQKMEAIGTLAGGIAHDFNNILAGIIGYTELAINSIDDDPPVKKMLEQVIDASGRATDLVRQILSFSRSHKSEVKPTSPSTITKEVLKLMRASLPSTIEIKQTINSSGYILADATKIHQVLMNLCTNASYAMGEKGGILEVILEEENIGPDNLALFTGITPGPYLRLSVKDTGTGISPDIKEKIFEPYFTTKGPGEGTGLGLSVVHGIVIEYGGNITVESESGKGTTFNIFLPLTEIKTPFTSNALAPLPRGNEHILLVDDEKVIVDMTQLMLEKLGYRVTARASSVEALEAFRNRPEQYDLVITDMTMPNMTGKELAKELISIRPDTSIIMCTGFSEQINEDKAKKIGVRAYIMKPVIFRCIAKTVREVLDNCKNPVFINA